MNRRQFLAATATALAATSGCSICDRAPSDRWRLRLSTSTILFRHLPIEQACEQIAKLGFDGVDIWSGYEGCPHLDDALNRLGPGGLNAVLARLGLRLTAFSTYVGGYAKYAALLGESWRSGLAIQGSAGPCKPEELSARMKAFFESQKPLIELAEKHDSYLAIENHGQALLDSLDSFKAFVDLNPSPRLGIALAPYHLQAVGASVAEAVRTSGRQLFFFYAWQKADGLGQLPGVGPTDFKPLLLALRDIGYHRFVNPFMHGDVEPDHMAAALAKSRTYLQTLAPRPGPDPL
jgi:sugar phosphate isomerase/epimerase